MALRNEFERKQFQCSSASRKFLNRGYFTGAGEDRQVSVLFSEPKIPQYNKTAQSGLKPQEFQCSSASRKFLNLAYLVTLAMLYVGFSALQRAENSSIYVAEVYRDEQRAGFSALQRAENSSIGSRAPRRPSACAFQCSSASRKFLNHRHESRTAHDGREVSVLFSEPKIPQ